MKNRPIGRFFIGQPQLQTREDKGDHLVKNDWERQDKAG
jgi:hypothetical protein